MLTWTDGREEIREVGAGSDADMRAPSVRAAKPSRDAFGRRFEPIGGAGVSSSAMILVVGHFFVRPEDRARVLELSTEAVRLARQAPGNLDFSVGADLVDDTRVNVCERWADKASLDTFRGQGPDDGLGALIVSFHVRELEVADR